MSRPAPADVDPRKRPEGEQAPVMMDHKITLTYHEVLPPNLVAFSEALIAGRITGHKCPECGRVYVPGRGFCALDTVKTGPEHEVEVSDVGTVTGFTIITPVQYYGQTKTEDFVYASVLLDGSSGALGGQEIIGIPLDQVRNGLRVRAVWKPEAERNAEGLSARGWGGLEGAISAFEVIDEPDWPREKWEVHI